MRVVLYTGPAGVGKTTTAAATALWAARRGERVLVVSGASPHGLHTILQRRLSRRATRVATRLDAIEVDRSTGVDRPSTTARRFFEAFRDRGAEDVFARELAWLPGARELTTLLVADERARSGQYDIVVVDCAPSRALLHWLMSPRAARATRSAFIRAGRVVAAAAAGFRSEIEHRPACDRRPLHEVDALFRRSFQSLQALFSDARTTMRLVVTPESAAVDEAQRVYADLQGFGIRCDGVVINRLLPPVAAREPFFREWWAVQRDCEARLAECFAAMPVLHGVLQEDEVRGLERLGRHADGLFGREAPSAVSSATPRLVPRFEDNLAALAS